MLLVGLCKNEFPSLIFEKALPKHTIIYFLGDICNSKPLGSEIKITSFSFWKFMVVGMAYWGDPYLASKELIAS